MLDFPNLPGSSPIFLFVFLQGGILRSGSLKLSLRDFYKTDSIRTGIYFRMKNWEAMGERKNTNGIKVNKGNFAATLIRFNQNLNYEKIYVFRMQI